MIYFNNYAMGPNSGGLIRKSSIHACFSQTGLQQCLSSMRGLLQKLQQQLRCDVNFAYECVYHLEISASKSLKYKFRGASCLKVQTQYSGFYKKHAKCSAPVKPIGIWMRLKKGVVLELDVGIQQGSTG